MGATQQTYGDETYWEEIRRECLTPEERSAEDRTRSRRAAGTSYLLAAGVSAIAAIMLSPFLIGAWSAVNWALR